MLQPGRRTLIAALSLAAIVAAVTVVTPKARGQAKSEVYRVDKTIPLGGAGGWDLLAFEPQSHLLYVPRSTHLMVIDVAAGKAVADIAGGQRNHGVAVVPSAGRGFISDGGAGAIIIFDLKSNAILGKLDAPKDADDILFDSASGKVLCVSGDEGCLVPLAPDVDPTSGKTDARIDLGGKPEAMAIDGNGKAFVNLEDKDQVAVVDTRAMKVIDHWPVAPGGSPVGMAIDPAHRRLFVACRKPQKMIVMNADDGKVLADVAIGAGVDGAGFDDGEDGGYALASCRDGTLAVVGETSPGKFELVQTVPTKPGARTMTLDPATHTIYLPAAEMQPTTHPGGRPAAKPDSFMILVLKRR